MMYGNSDFDWHEDENNQIRARAEVYREEQQEETIRKLKAKVALLEKALAEQPAQQEPLVTKTEKGIVLHVGWDDLPVGAKLYTFPPEQRKEGK